MGGCYEGAISPIAIRGNRVRSVTCTSEMVMGVGRHPSLREEPAIVLHKRSRHQVTVAHVTLWHGMCSYNYNSYLCFKDYEMCGIKRHC